MDCEQRQRYAVRELVSLREKTQPRQSYIVALRQQISRRCQRSHVEYQSIDAPQLSLLLKWLAIPCYICIKL